MSLMDAVKSVYSNYANFGGRARRSEYWYFYLFCILVNIGLEVLLLVVGGGGTSGSTNILALIVNLIGGLWGLATIVPQLAVGVRRLHDTGRSGWWLLLWFALIIGWIILLIWLCQRSSDGPNKYGPNPINPINVNVF